MSPHLRALAARQGCVFTAAQARAVGYTHAEIQRLRRAGVWRTLRRGVYAEAVVVDGAEPAALHRLRVAAALQAIGGDPCASHRSAALLHGLDLLETPSRVELAAAAGDHRKSVGLRLLIAELPASDVQREPGRLACTAVTRTVLDLA